MIKLFPKIIKMKRAVKISTAATSGQKQVDSSRLKKTKDVDTQKEKRENPPRIAKIKETAYSTRNRKAKQSDGTQNKSQESKIETKVDLSMFKLTDKQNIKGENSTRKQTSKRQHIQVQYDDHDGDSSSNNKIKKQSQENSDSDQFKIEQKTSKLVEQTFLKNMPPDWEEVLKNLREMRKNFDAPVDLMGCDQCPDQMAEPEDKRFQSLVSLMLSSQTKDQVTHAAMLRLREHGCTLTNILNTPDEKLGELIYPVGFWKTKVKNLKRTAQMIKDEFNSDIPKTVEDLCKLPGVGPKMAHLCMKTAWGQITGIGVDTHVHRISNRLGWVKTKTPEDTRKALESWLPHDLWSDVNHLLVGFGQQTCQPIKPHCTDCLNNQLCSFGKKEVRGGKAK